MASVSKYFGWMSSNEDRTVADGTDDAPKIRALMDRVNTGGRGGFLVLERNPQPFFFDTTIEVRVGEEFVVPAGVEIFTRAGLPAFSFESNYGNVTGRGLITAQAGSPQGIIRMGNGLNPTLWNHLHRLRLRGDGSAGSVGIYAPPDPTPAIGNYWNDIEAVHVERVETAFWCEDRANAQKFRSCDVQRIGVEATPGDPASLTGGVVWKLDSDQNQIIGGSVHSSQDVIVHQFNDTVFNYSLGVVAEPGGVSSFAHINGGQQNWVQGIANAAGAIIDTGSQNSILTTNRMDFGANRVGFYDQTPITQPATNADIHTTGLAAAP